MKDSLIIRKIIAVFMLMVFSFGITPKQLLHDWFANHTDTKCKLDHSNKNLVQLTASGYHCQTDNLVVTSPFENTSAVIEIFSPSIHILQNDFFIKELFSLSHSVTSLRGPPIC